MTGGNDGQVVVVRFYDEHAAEMCSVPVDVPAGAVYISVTRFKPGKGKEGT